MNTANNILTDKENSTVDSIVAISLDYFCSTSKEPQSS